MSVNVCTGWALKNATTHNVYSSPATLIGSLVTKLGGGTKGLIGYTQPKFHNIPSLGGGDLKYSFRLVRLLIRQKYFY